MRSKARPKNEVDLGDLEDVALIYIYIYIGRERERVLVFYVSEIHYTLGFVLEKGWEKALL